MPTDAARNRKTFSNVTKARHSYRLRPGLARSGNGPLPVFRRRKSCRKARKIQQNLPYSAGSMIGSD
jgi:hypothetical protein